MLFRIGLFGDSSPSGESCCCYFVFCEERGKLNNLPSNFFGGGLFLPGKGGWRPSEDPLGGPPWGVEVKGFQTTLLIAGVRFGRVKKDGELIRENNNPGEHVFIAAAGRKEEE